MNILKGCSDHEPEETYFIPHNCDFISCNLSLNLAIAFFSIYTTLKHTMRLYLPFVSCCAKFEYVFVLFKNWGQQKMFRFWSVPYTNPLYGLTEPHNYVVSYGKQQHEDSSKRFVKTLELCPL